MNAWHAQNVMAKMRGDWLCLTYTSDFFGWYEVKFDKCAADYENQLWAFNYFTVQNDGGCDYKLEID